MDTSADKPRARSPDVPDPGRDHRGRARGARRPRHADRRHRGVSIAPAAIARWRMRSTGISGAVPDVILTDIGLPGMDGIEGTRILRDRFPAVPDPGAERLRRRRERVQRDLRRRVGVPAEEHGAGAAAGIADGSRERRRADVARHRAPRHHALPGRIRPPERASYHLTPQETRAPEADGRRTPLQDRGARDGHLGQHRLVPPETHLRKAAGPLQDARPSPRRCANVCSEPAFRPSLRYRLPVYVVTRPGPAIVQARSQWRRCRCFKKRESRETTPAVARLRSDADVHAGR